MRRARLCSAERFCATIAHVAARLRLGLDGSLFESESHALGHEGHFHFSDMQNGKQVLNVPMGFACVHP
jgi:hypothetical protein